MLFFLIPQQSSFYFVSMNLTTQSISQKRKYLSFCDWLISFNIKSSMFIYAVLYVKLPSFLKLTITPVYVYTTFCLSIHLWMMDTLWLLPFGYVSSADVNMYMRRFDLLHRYQLDLLLIKAGLVLVVPSSISPPQIFNISQNMLALIPVQSAVET